MADELIRLDTTIIGIDSLINKALTAEEAKVLFTVKDVIYSQQRYFTDVQAVKHGKWEYIRNVKLSGTIKLCECNQCHNKIFGGLNYCGNCGAKMDGEQND
jgi:hypothetical protein